MFKRLTRFFTILIMILFFIAGCSTFDNIGDDFNHFNRLENKRGIVFIFVDLKGDQKTYRLFINKNDNKSKTVHNHEILLSSESEVEAFKALPGVYRLSLLVNEKLYLDLHEITKPFVVKGGHVNYGGALLITSNLNERTIEFIHQSDDRVFNTVSKKFKKKYKNLPEDYPFINGVGN